VNPPPSQILYTTANGKGGIVQQNNLNPLLHNFITAPKMKADDYVLSQADQARIHRILT
jgi:hypothetical protein